MAARRSVWVRTLRKEEKDAIATRCERFIEDVLKPRFLPAISPTQFNYPVDISGKWRGDKYSFVQRFRSGFPENRGEEFDHAFTRLDYCGIAGEPTFDVMWHRDTGQWLCLFPSVTLDGALELIESLPHLQPIA